MSDVLAELLAPDTDLAALMLDAPERSLYERELEAELAEERAERGREPIVSRPRRERPSEARRREIAARIEELRNAKTGGGRMSWEEIIAKLGKEFDPAQVAVVVDVHRVSVREESRSGSAPRRAPVPQPGGDARQREIQSWVQSLRDPGRVGGPVSWERVRAILSEARYDEADVDAATRSVEVREDAARRAYTGEPSEQELAEREARFDEAWGDDGEALLEELADGLRGG